MYKINSSIVLYHNIPNQLEKVIKCFLNINLAGNLYLIDNSKDDSLSVLKKIDKRIIYIFNNANLGYGTAHNIAIRESIKGNVPYHLVLNPDIYFESGVLETLYNYMEKNKNVGQIMPKVLYPDGTIQYLCKLLPTPFDLFGRRFFNIGLFKKYIDKRNNKYELRFTTYNKIMNVPYLSGCFMFFRTKALQDIGLFDERFFMYPEDIDITRRMHAKYKTIYYPDVSIIHDHGAESYKNIGMLRIHIVNMVKYFNKWGWYFDKERNLFNKRILNDYNYYK
jgi:GT2 family glycosyltransferase